MPDLKPEQLARQQIDAQLVACGWVVQDYKAVDFSAGRGLALREVPLKTGPCDYLLLVDRQALGVIEAKAENEGSRLSTVADQSDRYASSLPDLLSSGLSGQLPFRYESTGVETYFRDSRDPHSRSRRVFSFHRPETLIDWFAESDTLRDRLAQMPTAHPLATNGMRDCQIEAITGLEKSFAENRPRALIHMATGAGKTFTACAFTYRLIKYAKARRILFLVDRANRLWDAFAVTEPAKVKGRSQAGRFADLVALVRFALEQQPVLAPFADSVSERFDEWLADKTKAGSVFTPEQLAWLNLIRDHVATSLSIEPDDFDYSPFSQRGGLGKAHQLFGEQLPILLDELNEALAA